VNLKDINDLQKIEDRLGEIREILNPEDSPYICDTIVRNIKDEELGSLIEEMLLRMGYKKNILLKVRKIVKQIQS